MVSHIRSATDAGFTTRDPAVTQLTIQHLIDQHFVDLREALVTQFQDQGRLLEEAKRDLAETRRDLEVYKKAFSIAEQDKRDLKERLEQEKQARNDEIRQLRERSMYGGEERFEQEKQALKDGILQLKAIITRKKRATHQQNPLPLSSDNRQHAVVREGAKAA